MKDRAKFQVFTPKHGWATAYCLPHLIGKNIELFTRYGFLVRVNGEYHPAREAA